MGIRTVLERVREGLRGRAGASSKGALVYPRGADVLVHSQLQTTTGLWILAEPVTRLDGGCSDGIVGSTLRAALEASRSGVCHPKEFKRIVEPLLRAAGVRSYKAFVEGARCVPVHEREGRLTLTPTRNLGSKEGFAEEPGAAIVVPATSADEALGAALRAVLDAST